MNNMKTARGFTLIEIIVTIVVVGIAATALLSVFTNMIRGSADPVIQQQATTIAEAYLEEISLRAFSDPTQVETGGAEGGETRATYDDVQDYSDIPAASAPEDQFGVAIPSLSDYRVTVTITDPALGSIPAGGDALLIEVEVDHDAIAPITLSRFRTNY